MMITIGTKNFIFISMDKAQEQIQPQLLFDLLDKDNQQSFNNEKAQFIELISNEYLNEFVKQSKLESILWNALENTNDIDQKNYIKGTLVLWQDIVKLITIPIDDILKQQQKFFYILQMIIKVIDDIQPPFLSQQQIENLIIAQCNWKKNKQLMVDIQKNAMNQTIAQLKQVKSQLKIGRENKQMKQTINALQQTIIHQKKIIEKYPQELCQPQLQIQQMAENQQITQTVEKLQQDNLQKENIITDLKKTIQEQQQIIEQQKAIIYYVSCQQQKTIQEQQQIITHLLNYQQQNTTKDQQIIEEHK